MATVYWFGGTGNWSDQANHWSNNSGNSPASLHGSVPGTDDDVVFDTASSAAEAAYTVTVDVAANCQNFTMDGPSTTDATKVTVAYSSGILRVYGNLYLSGGTAGITWGFGQLVAMYGASGTKTIDTNGITIVSSFRLEGAGTFQLTNTFRSSYSSPILRNAGTFDANGQLVYVTSNNFTSQGLTYYDLTIIGTAVATGNATFNADTVVTNTLTITGNSSTNYLTVKSNIAGTHRHLTAATFVVDNVAFQDITCDGAGAPCVPTTTAMDMGGNSGITFDYDRFWVGGTGNWSDGTHWSLTSGGTGNQIKPYIYDDVTFDTSSSTSEAAYTVTVNETAYCLDFTMDGPSTTDATKVTWAGSSALNIYGNLSLSGGTAGITMTFSGGITFRATTTGKTIAVNGVAITTSATFNGVGGEWTLQNDYLKSGSSKDLTISNGTFITDNYALTVSNISISSGNITAGTSTITCSQWVTTNNSLSVASSTITIAATGVYFFTAGTNTYGTINLSYAGGASNSYSIMSGAFSCSNLTITGANTIVCYNTIGNNITITGTLTLTGYSSINRFFVKSDTLGTPRTITAAVISISNADFQDITGAGDATWDMSAATGGSGNCGGNTMKALGDAAFTTADTWYWHADTGNVSDYSKWYTETNGGGTQMASTMVPLPQDTLRFDDSSFTAGSKTVTQNMPRIGSVDFTGATNTPAFTTSTAASVFGSITLISGMTLTNSTQAYTFEGRGSYTLDSGGLTWAKTLNINNRTGSITLKSNLATSVEFNVISGTFTSVDGVNNYNITVRNFYSNNTNTRSINLGSSLITLTAVDVSPMTCYSLTGLTFNAGTSTIKLTGVLTANLDFEVATPIYNFWNATTGNYVITHKYSNTYNDLKIDAGRHVHFTNSTTTTVNTFTALGTSGSHITISNSSSTTHATLTKAGGGVIYGCDYIDIQEMTGSPASTWYIGANSTDTGSTCTNIILQDPPAATAAITGTATASIKANDIVTGGKTILITLAYEAWLPTASFDAQRQAIIDGLDSAQSEATGWNAEVRDKMAVTSVVRTSDSVVTVTLPASASYAITAPETITVTVPASAVARNGAITGSPTFDVSLAGATATGNFFLIF